MDEDLKKLRMFLQNGKYWIKICNCGRVNRKCQETKKNVYLNVIYTHVSKESKHGRRYTEGFVAKLF